MLLIFWQLLLWQLCDQDGRHEALSIHHMYVFLFTFLTQQHKQASLRTSQISYDACRLMVTMNVRCCRHSLTQHTHTQHTRMQVVKANKRRHILLISYYDIIVTHWVVVFLFFLIVVRCEGNWSDSDFKFYVSGAPGMFHSLFFTKFISASAWAYAYLFCARVLLLLFALCLRVRECVCVCVYVVRVCRYLPLMMQIIYFAVVLNWDDLYHYHHFFDHFLLLISQYFYNNNNVGIAAQVNKKMFSSTDTYHIEVAAHQDILFFVALASCIDRMHHHRKWF